MNGHIYGLSSNGSLVCQELASGKVTCQDKTIGKGSTVYADGLLYCYEETQGIISLVRPGTNAVSVISSFKAPEGSGEHWAHPASSDSRLYIRHGEALMVYDIQNARVGWRNDSTGRLPAAAVTMSDEHDNGNILCLRENHRTDSEGKDDNVFIDK